MAHFVILDALQMFSDIMKRDEKVEPWLPYPTDKAAYLRALDRAITMVERAAGAKRPL